jgi:hypothetical protein
MTTTTKVLMNTINYKLTQGLLFLTGRQE